jgi:hypothetical protein
MFPKPRSLVFKSWVSLPTRTTFEKARGVYFFVFRNYQLNSQLIGVFREIMY